MKRELIERGFLHIQRSMELSEYDIDSTYLNLLQANLIGALTKEELFHKIRINAKKFENNEV